MGRNENLAAIIAENLTYYRKKAKLTQSELASKLNYSDKSISKWERGEGVPDIFILDQLARLYGLSVNDFLSIRKKARIANVFISRVLIFLLSVGLVWFVFTSVFAILLLTVPHINDVWPIWLLFIYAIPVSCIVAIVLNDVFFKRIFNMIYVSILCWSTALSIYLSFSSYPRMAIVFIVAIPFQILIILFYLLMFKRQKNKRN